MELRTESQKKIILKLAKYILNSSYDIDMSVSSYGMISLYFRRNKSIAYNHDFFTHKADWQKEYKICMVNIKHQIKLSKELEKIK